MNRLVFLCGVYSLALAAFHIGFWKIFGWAQELPRASVSTRAIIQIANLCLIYLFLMVAYLCFRFPGELTTTPLGRSFMLGMGGFWLARFAEQFVFLRYNKPFIHILSVVFALGALLFFFALGG